MQAEIIALLVLVVLAAVAIVVLLFYRDQQAAHGSHAVETTRVELTPRQERDFVHLVDKDGGDIFLNMEQVREVYVPVGDGMVEITYGTGNNYREITKQEYEEKLKAPLLEITV
jgi:hypothetical protein